jgi:DNA topoisomerase-1
MNYYLKDTGIYKKGTNYYYHDNNKRVLLLSVLTRLNSFRVPPAWTNVWYASSDKSHIQVHGIDVSGKKQYILSERWNSTQKAEKFNRIHYFIKDLPAFRNKIKLNNIQDDKEFLIKLLFNLLLDLHIRVGNEIYASTNKTYGLTTLKQKHLVSSGGGYTLSFVGKSKIHHEIAIPGEYSKIIKRYVLPNKPNYPLFYYYLNNKIKNITSDELNEFLKENMGSNYSCKDFRTYSANILFIKEFLKNNKKTTKTTKTTNSKKFIMNCIDNSAKQLGHSRSICKKSYISNNLLDYCIVSFSEASSASFTTLVSKISGSGSSSLS